VHLAFHLLAGTSRVFPLPFLSHNSLLRKLLRAERRLPSVSPPNSTTQQHVDFPRPKRQMIGMAAIAETSLFVEIGTASRYLRSSCGGPNAATAAIVRFALLPFPNLEAREAGLRRHERVRQRTRQTRRPQPQSIIKARMTALLRAREIFSFTCATAPSTRRSASGWASPV
jgi:hypothetical protein